MATNEQDELDRKNILRFIQHFLGSHNSALSEDVIKCGCVATLIEGSREQARLALAHHTKEAERRARIDELEALMTGAYYSPLEDIETHYDVIAKRRLAELAAPTPSPQQPKPLEEK